MTRLNSLIAAIADAALTVAIGLLVPLVITVASWLITGGFQTTAFEVPFTTAAAVWSLGLGGGVGFNISPETYPSLGIAEPFRFVVSIAPLAFTALIAGMGWHAGRKLADDDLPWIGLVVGTAAFAAGAWLSLTFAGTDLVRIDVRGAVIVGTLIWLLGMLVGVRAWDYLPWENWLRDRFAEVADLVARAMRIAGALVVGTLALATALLIVALVTSMGRVIGLMEALQLDIASIVGIGLLQLAYVPTLLVWAAAWMLGPGIQLGTGSTATLGGTDAGPLPIVPLLGLLPEEGSPYLWALIALPVVLTALVTVVARSRDSDIDDRVWWERLLAPGVGALAAAGILALLAQLSRGAIGPGRLQEFGPQPGWVLLAAFGLFILGGAIGAFLPLESASGEASGSEDRDAEPEEAEARSRPHLALFQDVLDRVLRERDSSATEPAVDTEPPEQPEPPEQARRTSPYSRPPKRIELRDAIHRPDEPDIYADLDVDDDRK